MDSGDLVKYRAIFQTFVVCGRKERKKEDHLEFRR
jgi:hypothetical protein